MELEVVLAERGCKCGANMGKTGAARLTNLYSINNADET
jgi:hypothetical protein